MVYGVKSGAEGEILLPEEADDDSEEGDADLRGRRIPTPGLHQELQAEVVDSQIECDNHDVSRELPRSMKSRLRESDVFVQPESREQGDGEDDAEGSDVRSETELIVKSREPEVDEVVADDEVVCQEVENPVQNHVASATGCVPKKLLRYVVLKRRIYKINNFSNYLC